METDFRDAADRHRGDALLLLEMDRLANADYLFGLAAECGLKALMVALGMATSSHGVPREYHHKVHVDALWDEFLAFAGGRGGARYALRLGSDNPFGDWRISQRYCHRSGFGHDRVTPHARAARLVRGLLDASLLDGVVS